MKKTLEKPFEYLKRKDGSAYSPETIKNWYKARTYVLDKLKNVAMGPESKAHLNLVVTSDTPVMLSVVRQAALLAHFPNYDETKGQNRSIITLVSKNPKILEELAKEEYLCNLLTYCKYSAFGATPIHLDSYIDIELQIVNDWQDIANQNTIIMSEKELETFLQTKKENEVYSIDTRRAVLTNYIYSIGSLIDNLPAENIHDPHRYGMALRVFQNKMPKRSIPALIEPAKWETDQISVKNGLSNVFCADCYDLKSAFCHEENIESLSKCEHARWVVEKLIMGFRPLNQQERIHDGRLFGEEKKQYRSQLKKSPSDPVHIDLCSYADLRRINPDDLKYDSFLMMAIPMIQNHIR